jgi:high-affinity Fe2+/Pb2+ permease
MSSFRSVVARHRWIPWVAWAGLVFAALAAIFVAVL